MIKLHNLHGRIFLTLRIRKKFGLFIGFESQIDLSASLAPWGAGHTQLFCREFDRLFPSW
jgi:hypothetical protein